MLLLWAPVLLCFLSMGACYDTRWGCMLASGQT